MPVGYGVRTAPPKRLDLAKTSLRSFYQLTLLIVKWGRWYAPGTIRACLAVRQPLMRSLLEESKRCGVDAVIVADIAAVNMAREFGIEVHISTQLSVANYEAVKFFAQWS